MEKGKILSLSYYNTCVYTMYSIKTQGATDRISSVLKQFDIKTVFNKYHFVLILCYFNSLIYVLYLYLYNVQI